MVVGADISVGLPRCPWSWWQEVRVIKNVTFKFSHSKLESITIMLMGVWKGFVEMESVTQGVWGYQLILCMIVPPLQAYLGAMVKPLSLVGQPPMCCVEGNQAGVFFSDLVSEMSLMVNQKFRFMASSKANWLALLWLS